MTPTIDPLVAGDAVTWRQTLRGGYGYVCEVPAVVLSLGRARVRIAVLTNNGELVRRSVHPASLRPPTATGAPLVAAIRARLRGTP